MSPKEFIKKWFVGTKEYAKSPLGILESQLVINSFLSFGCFLGTVQRFVIGDGVLSFIFFAVGLLTAVSSYQMYIQYKPARKQFMAMRRMKK